MVTLPLIADLLRELEARGIRYCHWKSTSGLSVALAGRTDLDLLVDPADADAFAAMAESLDFKRFASHRSRVLPGVDDWLGLDRGTRRLVHLHVYHQLILGEELVKNHALPIERALLDQTEVRHGIRVPLPSLELAVLAIRALLKYRDDAFVRDVTRLGHRGGLPSGITDEVAELMQRTDVTEVRAAVERHVPMVPPGLIVEFLDASKRTPVHAGHLRRLRLDLERALRGYERRSRLAIVPMRVAAAVNRSRFARAARRLDQRVRGRPSGRRKRPVAGGRSVAVVGIDGSGKSTVIQALTDTFGWRLNVATLYLGSARPGLGTASVQTMARVARRANTFARRHMDERNPMAQLSTAVADVGVGLRALAEARERSRRIRLGMRLAADGWLVLYDRYPMPGLAVGERDMDASRLEFGSADPASWRALLARRERAMYRNLPSPDLLITLQVDPATARSRKGAAPAALNAKAAALDRLREMRHGGVVIDASRPLDEVLVQATAAVWDCL